MKRKNNNLAFVFPGQGSQSVGMLSELAASYGEVKQTFERASDALCYDLWALVKSGPIEQLNQTQNTQPVMLAAGFAVWQVWCKQASIRPAWMAGHSLGEYTALVCSGALLFEDAIKLVAERGRLMQIAVPEGIGAMAAILGLEDQQVVNVCAEAAEQEVVAAVNFNAPGQVVIAGHVAAVDRAIALAKAAGAKKAIALPVSVPSHCQLMAGAANQLAEKLLAVPINTPEIPVIHNVDICSHSVPAVIRTALKEQLYKPVRWADSIQFMSDQGVEVFVECGPGKVLLGLNKRIVKTAEHLSIYDPATLNQILEQLHG
ncbi:MAG: ACP S-malonyltransferase [Methylococcaceae bacterium]|nr:ACP S-malonyltransferase [Methylococcaceae bacterium]